MTTLPDEKRIDWIHVILHIIALFIIVPTTILYLVSSWNHDIVVPQVLENAMFFLLGIYATIMRDTIKKEK